MKKPKRAPRATPKPKAAPTVAAYMIKNIDRTLWAEFATRAKAEGRTIAWLFRDFITRYVNGASA